MFPSQRSILTPPLPPPFTKNFHPFEDQNMNLPTHNPFIMEGPLDPISNLFYGIEIPSLDGGSSFGSFGDVHSHHPMAFAPNNNALDGHYKDKAIFDFSEQSMGQFFRPPSPLSLPNECGMVVTDNNWEIYERNQNMEMDHNIAKDSTSKSQWTPAEDRALVELVEQYGLKKWAQIAKLLQARSGKQCRERWHNHLQPNIRKDPWTLEEDMALIRAHQEVGNKWSEIEKWLPGRTENTIKNHWNATKRRLNCKRHNKSKHGSCEGSVLSAYVKWVTLNELKNLQNYSNNP